MVQSVLSYEEFIIYIKENIEASLDDLQGAYVSITQLIKNNGVMVDTLTIVVNESGSLPLFYLKDLYGSYLQGEKIDDMVSHLLDYCRQHQKEHGSLNEEWFNSLENVYDKIVMKVVNYEKNKEQLEQCPYIRELDLALTFRILLEREKEQLGTVLVNCAMMKKWETSEFDLFDMAVRNMERIWQPTLDPIGDVIENFLPYKFECEDSFSVPMYVLSNDMRFYGATVPFYTECIKEFAIEQKRDLYILPSSIHEVLLIPDEGDMSAWELRKIVQEVNNEIVEDEEILSDHVYRYLYQENRLIIGA